MSTTASLAVTVALSSTELINQDDSLTRDAEFERLRRRSRRTGRQRAGENTPSRVTEDSALPSVV